MDLEEEKRIQEDRAARDYVVSSFAAPENVLISASAGAGKSTTLVSRIVNRTMALPKELHVDTFCVVTFTTAAASELREKIADKLAGVMTKAGAREKEIMDSGVLTEELRKEAEEARERALRAYTEKLLLPKAMIGTIDAFCLDVVKKNFTVLGIEPAFTIDNMAARQLRDDTVDEVLEERYGRDPEREETKVLRKLLDIFCSVNTDRKLKDDLICRVLETAETLPDPIGWLEDLKSKYAVPEKLSDSIWYGKTAEDLSRRAADAEKRCRKALNDLADGVYPLSEDNAELARLVFEADAKFFADVQASLAEEDGLFRTGLSPKWETFKAFRKNSPEAEKTLKKLLADEVRNPCKDYWKNAVKACLGNNCPEQPEDRKKWFADGIGVMRDYVNTVADIAEDVYKKTLEKCREKNVYSFSGIAHMALEVLGEKDPVTGDFRPSDVARAYADRFTEIYIDEYQDTSMLQEAVLTLVSRVSRGEPNMFMVGDVKQSIYSFRNAKPDLFLGKMDRFARCPEQGTLKILGRNFRCRKGIIDGVNAVFCQVMTRETAGIEYRDGHRLSYGAGETYDANPLKGDPEDGRCELIVCQTPAREEEEPASESGEPALDGTLREYGYAALRIAELFSGGFQTVDKDSREQKPLRFSDICVIAKSRRNLDRAAKVFEECGIPVDWGSAEPLYDTAAVRALLDFLRVIDNPHQDIPLAGVLRSDFFGVTDNETAALRILGGTREDLYTSLRRAAEKSERTDGPYGSALKKCGVFLRALEKFRLDARTGAVSNLVWLVMNFNDYYGKRDAVGKSCLRAILEDAVPYDKGVNGGLYGFLRDTDKKIEFDKQESTRRKAFCPSGVSDNRVKFMTVHGSKGLEFPVVFLMGTAGHDPSDDSPCRISEELGIGFRFPVERGDGKVTDLEQSAPMLTVERAQKTVRQQELQRDLYVAMTRAREKLIVTAGADFSKISCWEEAGVCPPSDAVEIKTAGTFYDLTRLGVLCGDIGSSWAVRSFDETLYLSRIRDKVAAALKPGVENTENIFENEDGGAEDETAENAGNFFENTETAGNAETAEAAETAENAGYIFENAENAGNPEAPGIPTLPAGAAPGPDALLTARETDRLTNRFHNTLAKAGDGTLPAKLSVSALKKMSADEETGAETNPSVYTPEFRDLFENTEEDGAQTEKTSGGNQVGASAGGTDAAGDGNLPENTENLEAASSEKQRKKAKKLTGAEFGTLMHKCLRFLIEERKTWIGLAPPEYGRTVKEQLDGFARRGLLTPEERENAAPGMLVRFLQSPVAEDLRRASAVRCETSFTFRTDIGKYFPDERSEAGDRTEKTEAEGGKELAIQGVIDLYYILDGRLIIVDFKSDREEPDGTVKNTESYRLQLRCYADALTSVSGTEVSEACLYFLRSGKKEIVEINGIRQR